MKLLTPALFVLALSTVSTFAGQAFANANEDAQIEQWMDDNSDEGQSAETVKAYCECASGKMGMYEQQSVTDWEKQHADEQEACSKEAGWKY